MNSILICSFPVDEDPNKICSATVGGWYPGSAGGYHGTVRSAHVIVISLNHLLYLQTVIVQGSGDGNYDRLNGYSAWMAMLTPNLSNNDMDFDSSGSHLCGSVALTGSYPNQLFPLACQNHAHGILLIIRLTGVQASITRIGAYSYPQGIY